MRLLSRVPWMAMLCWVGWSITPLTPVNEPPPTPVRVPSPPAPPPAPRDFSLRFALEPGQDGVRRLVLRDDHDLRLLLGDVQPLWACDARADGGEWDESAAMRVGCGGGALEASVSGYTDRRGVEYPLEVQSSTGVEYLVPREPKARVTLDPRIFDPAGGCVPWEDGRVDVSIDQRWFPPQRDKYAPGRTIHIHSAALPLDEKVEATQGQRCSIQRDSAGTELLVRCWYPDEPFEHDVDVRVRQGELLWTTEEAMPDVGIREPKGGWRLGCGETVRWAGGVQVVKKLDEWASIELGPSEGREVSVPVGGWE